MKTKIIYVLVSNENDCYLEQALVSIYSLRLYNPDANLLLVSSINSIYPLVSDSITL